MTQIEHKTYEAPPDPGRLTEGLRDTGYNFDTALADIVDNSIDAAASRVDIRIEMDLDGDVLIMVADDGIGMDRAALRSGMTYGSPSLPDPSRLGKFGLGLKTASTAFCRRLAVITRDSAEMPPIKAAWDLDYIASEGKWFLIEDDPVEEEVATLNEVAPNSSGTLVIWDKVDRLLKSYADPGGRHAQNALNKAIEGLRQHVGMIYQRFLDTSDDRARNIEISINGNPVAAWNPFCETEDNTELVAEDTQVVEMSDGSRASFRIRAFVLPRKTEWSSDEARSSARATNANQGIYVYRENRLIHPADWLGMYSKEPHYTLLRVEFSFDHDLDQAFHVDIKKSRILLNEELFDYIYKQFLPAPRNAAEARYRKGAKVDVSQKAKNAHSDSNAALKSREEDLRLADIRVTNAASSEVEVTNKSGSVVLKLKLGTTDESGQVYVQTTESIDDGLLWEPALIDGHHAVVINEGHPYYRKVYVPNYSSGVIVQGMDSLLWAFAEAELGTVNEATRRHFDELRYEVSRLLRKLVEDLPEPDLEDTDVA